MTTPPRRFRKVRLSEISLVDMGADPHAVISIFKRAVPQNKEAAMADANDDPAVVAAQTILDLRKKLDAAEAKIAATPAVPDSVAAELAELKKANDKWRAEMAAITEEREIAKAVDLVRVEFPHLPIKPDEFGPVMKRAMALLSTEDVAVLKRLLKAADAAMVTLTKQVGGFGAPAAGSVEAEIEATATKLMASENVSFAKAYALAMERNPDLYTRFLTERGQVAN